MKKLHWGHKIGIVYILFAGFMISMVLKSRTAKHELVTEDYYQNELVIQDKINANNNLNAASFDVNISRKEKQILVSFDGLPFGERPTGKVHLYKPDNSIFDELIDMDLNDLNQMVISPKGVSGRYKVSVRFEVAGVDYYKEKQIVL